MDYFVEITNKIGTGGLITLLAAFIGVLGGIYVFYLHKFNSAYTRLSNAFTPAIARIDAAILHTGSNDAPEINNFLRDNFEAHFAAVQNFLPQITSRRKREAYQQAWQKYCDLEPNGGGITLFAGHAAPQGKYLEFIKEKIENILETAKN